MLTKEIGEQLKSKRLEIGISIEEVSEDIGVEQLLIENLEDGNSKAFKDMFELKELIINYTKYLGLNQEEMIDDFNDFIFGRTSKISSEDLNTKKVVEEKKKIFSPYTKEIKIINNKKFIIIAIVLVIIILLIIYFLLKEVMFNV